MVKLPVFFTNLFIINILVDPGNALFHSKIITFFLFIAFNIKNIKFKWNEIFPLILFYIFYFVSTAIMLLSNEKYDPSFIKMYSSTFLTLTVLIFTHTSNIDLWKPVKIAAFIISVSTLIIFSIVVLIPESVLLLSLIDIFTNVFMIAEHKLVLYWWIPSIFHKSSPILTMVLGYYLYKYLSKKELQKLIFVILYAFTISVTGTRANIISLLLIVFFISLYYILYIKKYVCFSFLLFIIGLTCFSVLVFLLFTVKNSSSVAKDGHLISYIEYFSENPTKFLFGQGPGALFYTTGFRQSVTNTELSYLELIRMFGIFFSTVMVFIYIYPVIILFASKTFFTFSISISYLAYLFIAGTNPLLIGPTGFTVLSIAFYIKNHRDLYEKS
jgi:hypothetical protein